MAKRTIRRGRLAILAGTAAFLGVGTVAAHEIQYRRQASLLLAQADELARLKNVPQSIQLYQQYLNFRPKDGEAMARYVAALESASTGRNRELQLLIDTYERLLLIGDAPRYDARQRLIDLYMKFGFFTNAKVHLRELETAEEKSFRNDPKLWENFAKCELGESQFKNLDTAIEYYRKAIGLKDAPAAAETFAELANLLRFEVKTKPAIAEADNVIAELVALRPTEIKARLVRAKYRIACNEAAKAKEDVEFIRRAGAGGDADVILAVANIDIAEKKFDQAKEILAGGLKAFPNDVRFHLTMTTVLLELGETKPAADQLKVSLTGLKPTAPMYFLAVDKLIDLNEPEHAQKAVTLWDAEEETRPQADFVRARLALRTGDWAVALGYAEACAKPIARLPGFAARGHLLLAQCQALAGNPDAVLTHTTNALRADPTLIQAKLLRADAFDRLGRYGSAAETLKDIKTVTPQARLSLAKALLAEQLTREPKQRSWAEFDAELAGPQENAELEVVRVESLIARGRTEEAVRAVEAAVARDPKRPPLQVALAELRAATQNPAAGLLTIDGATRACGDKPEFRIHKARILTMDPATATPKQVGAMADSLDAFTPDERHRVLMAVGQLMIYLKKPAEAVPFFRKAADAIPTDLASRQFLFDLACERGQFGQADEIAEEFRAIEGADGVTYTVCKAAAAMPTLDRKTPAPIIEWRRRVEAVKAKKETWGRLYACLGDLNELLGNDDAAVENYVRAIERGDRNQTLFRKTYAKLTARKQFEQANLLLAKSTAPTEFARWGAAWSLATKDPTQALSMIDPNSKLPDDHVLRAQLLVLAGRTDEAEPAFRKALTLSDGKSANSWLALVRFLVNVNKPTDAKRACEEAESTLRQIATADATGQTQLALGQCRDALGDLPAAETWFRKAVAAGGDSSVAVGELAGLFQRTNRRADAEKILADALKTTTGDVAKRQLRRQLAISKVSHAAGYQSIPEAVALVQQNIDEANQIEDVRAKALVLALDPFRLNEAKALLLETAQRFPLTATEHVMLAQIALAERDTERAESSLIAATRSTSVRPEHLALLSRVQVQADRTTQAQETVGKLKLISPTGWYTVTEEARLLAKLGRKDDAVAKMLALPETKDAVTCCRSVAPLLEEFGCLTAAEAQFRRALTESKAPNRHTYLASFFLRQRQPLDAIRLALEYAGAPDVPPGITARIMTGAVHSRKATDKNPSWDELLPKVQAFINAGVEKDAKNPDLRYAQAELADALGQYDEAIAAYDAALAVVPGHPVYANNLCYLLAVHAKDRSTRPLELMNDLIRLRGPDATRLDTRAMVHLAAGRTDEAIKDLDLALRLNPSGGYRFHLALAYEQAGNIARRDATFRLALLDKLDRDQLHPAERADYDRLAAPPKTADAK
jgi:tetratricopeptide (TPR) repeat protein